MAELNINKTTVGDIDSSFEDITVDYKNLDSVGQTEETYYTNDNFGKWLGIYKEIPEVKIAIDMRSIWTIGKGYEADPRTTIIFDHIKGNGKENFNSILKNLMVLKRINGDAYAEIVRDKETGDLVNLKPLNPQNIKVVFNSKGQITRYEQINRQDKGKTINTFSPEEVFHLSNKKIGDEIHGVSDIEAIEDIINALKESFDIQKQVIKHFSKPKMLTELDTDDQVKIDEFIAKFDSATAKGDNLFIPMNTVKSQVLAVSPNGTLNILSWRDHLKNYFFQVAGIPQIILGSSGEFTESTAKIAYLAFEQSVDDEQNEIEAQVWAQLHYKIILSFPTSLKNELLTDESKDGVNAKQMNVQPNEVTAGSGE